MPSEFLHIPPLYTLVGLYRLSSDPSIRGPVLDKIKHATIRGFVVGAIYAAGSWGVLRWIVKTFIVGGPGWFFGMGGARGKVAGAVGESGSGGIWVGVGSLGINVDLVLYTHLLILLPQISQILRFFVYKNLRLARSRAYALTVSSRRKPSDWWSQGYIEEWQQPPVAPRGESGRGAHRVKQAKWVGWLLWWPTQLVLRHYLLIPLSPTLPLIIPFVTSFLRAITTAEYLHQPYFEIKGMNEQEVWRWVEERKWAYRAFGFAASFLESIPIIGLFLSISNRVGAAMWAFDLEKRQHLFHHSVLKPLPPNMVGLWGTGSIHDVDVDIQKAEAEIEKKWADKGGGDGEKGNTGGTGIDGFVDLKGPGMGSEAKGREKLL